MYGKYHGPNSSGSQGPSWVKCLICNIYFTVKMLNFLNEKRYEFLISNVISMYICILIFVYNWEPVYIQSQVTILWDNLFCDNLMA